MISFSPEHVFLVTGASSGFGKASTVLLNRLGATVIATGRDTERLEEARMACPHPERCHCIARDLASDAKSLSGWVKELRERFGKLRGLLYCAGICEVVPVRLQEPESMRNLFEVNVFSAYQLARGFLDRRNNTGPGAGIVLIASTGALHDNAGTTSYSASKGAVLSLMRSLACEFVPQGIRINAVSPALVPTPMTEAFYADLEERAASYPLGAGTPDDIAQASAFLLSDAARWITGQNMIVDGGIGL